MSTYVNTEAILESKRDPANVKAPAATVVVPAGTPRELDAEVVARVNAKRLQPLWIPQEVWRHQQALSQLQAEEPGVKGGQASKGKPGRRPPKEPAAGEGAEG